MTVPRGRHTGTITVRAYSAAFLADAQAGSKPYYAFGFRITSADADTILLSKSFEVIAVRYENMLFGNYYHGGTTSVVDATGTVLSSEVYPTTVPSDEGTHGVYTLTTVAPDALTTNFRGTQEGSLRLTLDGAKVDKHRAEAEKQAQAAAEERRMAEQQLADSLAQSALEEAAEPAEEQPAGNDNEGCFD